jgi:hypothetical protein
LECSRAVFGLNRQSGNPYGLENRLRVVLNLVDCRKFGLSRGIGEVDRQERKTAYFETAIDGKPGKKGPSKRLWGRHRRWNEGDCRGYFAE